MDGDYVFVKCIIDGLDHKEKKTKYLNKLFETIK